VAVAVAVVGFVSGVALAGMLNNSASGRALPSGTDVAVPSVVAAPDRVSPSRAGALSAAAQSATLLSRLLPLEPAQARRVAADVAAEGYRRALVAAVDTELAPLQRQIAGLPGALYRQSVLATRLDSYPTSWAAGRARVSLWLLFMVGLGSEAADGAGERTNAVARFATVSLDLVWERNGWRLSGVDQRPGPTPLLDGVPQSAAELAAALAGFADWRPA